MLVAIGGCQHVEVVLPPGTIIVFGGTYRPETTPVEKLDLLFVIDEAPGAADLRDATARAVPGLLTKLRALFRLPTTGETIGLTDVHVGVIGSSLGGFGTGLCAGPHGDAHAHLLPRPGEQPAKGWAHDASGKIVQVDCPALSAGTPVSWATSANGARFVGDRDAAAFEAATSCAIASAASDGCTWPAPLEAAYRFLSDPAPYLTAEASCTTSASGTTYGKSVITPQGLDQALLDQRAAFLRDDSLLAVVYVGNHDDASLNPTSVNWLPLAYAPGTMPRGWKSCDGVPDDLEPDSVYSPGDWDTLHKTHACWSCLQPVKDGDGNVVTDPMGNCGAPWPSVAAGTPSLDVDASPLRAFHQVQRYGYSFLWGRKRYVDGFASPMVQSWDATAYRYRSVGNPIYAGGIRTRARVQVSGILGVPVARTRLDGGELEEAAWDAIASDDATRDAHLIEQIAPRAGIATFVGDRTIDAVHGGERSIPAGDDLQYACIGARSSTTPTTDCPPGAEATSPLCAKASDGTTNQPYFKAYPTLRQLRVLRALSSEKLSTLLASACAESYQPAMDAIGARLANAISGRCSSTPIDLSGEGGLTRCTVLRLFPSDHPRGASRCEEIGGALHPFCTPGASPCRRDGGGFPIDAPEKAAERMWVFGAEPFVEDGNLYVWLDTSKRALLCEVRQLVGDPSVDGGSQTRCLTDPDFDMPAGAGGGFCYSGDPAIVGATCVALGVRGAVRVVGDAKYQPGEIDLAACGYTNVSNGGW
jgi:hypothetical protein